MNENRDGGPATTGPPPQTQGPAPGARMALILLLGINLFNYIDRQVLAAVVPAIRDEFFGNGSAPGPVVEFFLGLLGKFLGSNPENALIGLLAMAFMATYMLMAPVFTMLRWKRWWIVAAGVAIWSLASGASGLATTFGMLLLTRCLVGVGEAAYGPVAPAMISDMYPERVRGRVLSWFHLAIPVGCALGFALGGLVGTSLGWRWAFYLVVPPGLLLGLLCLFMREPQLGLADGTQATPQRRLGLKEAKILLKTPSYLLNTLGMAMMCFAMGGVAFWTPSYVHEFRGVPNLAQINLIFGAILVVSGLGATLTGGLLADKLRARFPGSYFLVSGCAMLVGFPFFVASLYVPFPYAWGCIFMACVCLFFNTGPTNTILANVTHPSIRAAAYALNILLIHSFGDVISPLVIGAITDASGGNMNTGFLVVSVLVLVAGLVWLWAARYLARDTALATKQLDGDGSGGGPGTPGGSGGEGGGDGAGKPDTGPGAPGDKNEGNRGLRKASGILRRLIGLNGGTFRELLKRTIDHVLNQHEIFTRASAIAFAAMMAFVPFIALVGTICAYLLPDLSHPGATGIGNVSVADVEAALRTLFPGDSYQFVAVQIVRIQSQPAFALLSVSLAVSLWTASGLFLEVIDALNRIYGVVETRSWWALRIRAIVMTLVQSVILFGSLIAIAFWPQIIEVLGLDPSGATIAGIVKWVVIVFMLLLSFALTFKAGPNTRQTRRWVTPGAVFGTIVFLGATYLFQVYVQRFAQYELFYGSLGGIMILLVWFWITSMVLLMAAEMNRLAEIASTVRTTDNDQQETDNGSTGPKAD